MFPWRPDHLIRFLVLAVLGPEIEDVDMLDPGDEPTTPPRPTHRRVKRGEYGDTPPQLTHCRRRRQCCQVVR